MPKYKFYTYYDGFVICKYVGENKFKIPHFEEKGFMKLEDAFRYVDKLNEGKKVPLHIEYYHGYKKAIQEICLFLQNKVCKNTEIKVNRLAIKSLTELILENGENGFYKLMDNKRVWQDKKGEFFIK